MCQDRRTLVCDHCHTAMTADESTKIEGVLYHNHHTPDKVAEGIKRRKVATAMVAHNMLVTWPNRQQSLVH